MHRLTAFALVVLSCVPATAQQSQQRQQPPAQRQLPALQQSIELELLEMEQDADKTVLREALLLQARQGMKPAPDSNPEKAQHVELAAALRDFIDKKKVAIMERSTELTKSRFAPRRVATSASPADPPIEADRQAAIEKYEKAKIEVQLLQAQVSLLERPLEEAVQALAKAELDASNDESKRSKAEEARKAYDKLKAKIVEYNKRMHLEQQAMQPMQMQMMGMGGMGGRGGMGGGFR